ncbi:MAG: sensor domain-containing diguanylate cyclase [Chloroflexi bacterium]|nr:sensor domain-containing diguanylate cyclase [Chloroflexota bacterium]
MLGRLFLRAHPLTAQLATVLVGSSLVIFIALYTSQVVDNDLGRATNDTNAALLASEIRVGVDSIIVLRLEDSITSDEVKSGLEDPVIPLGKAIAAHEEVTAIRAQARELHERIGSAETLQIWDTTIELDETLDEYLLEPTLGSLTHLALDLAAIRELTRFAVPNLTSSAQADQDAAARAVWRARLATSVATIVSAAGVALATYVISRRLRKIATTAQAEESRLLETTKHIERRNAQFRALYQVVSEVTETLSMRYVVQTTIREARKLVGADLVGLRRLQNGMLVIAGTEQDPDTDVADLTPVALGSGLVGRVAKNGKTIRIDEGASGRMTQGEHVDGIESGLVVPLIVGARVVGTLGCWSRRKNHFTDDDERILEMMASQVATAITAADLHEATEQEAMHDPLTQLPNRRQLSEDIAGRLGEAVKNGEHIAIAMADIDHFKRFNDEYGHKMGDITLQKVAAVMRNSVRENDRVYRFGGEEILVVFAGANAENGMRLAERLRTAVEQLPLTGEHLEPVGPVTISIGVAAFPDHGDTVDALVEAADIAMYASKQAGRNSVTLAGSNVCAIDRAA